jgi:hypothetical protein
MLLVESSSGGRGGPSYRGDSTVDDQVRRGKAFPHGRHRPGHLFPDDLDDVANKMDDLVSGVPKMCPQEKQARAKTHPDLLILWWSCRESNQAL